MTEGFSNPIIGGGGSLVYPSIHSPNFSPGPPIAGWSIDKNGNAFFNTLDIGGTTAGSTSIDRFGNLKVENAFGAVVMYLSAQQSAFFEYANTGSAVQGQLIVSIASAAGVDPIAGFNYPAGLYGLDPVGGSMTVQGPVISYGEIPFTRAAQIKPVIASDNAHRPYLQLDAPEETTASHLQMIMAGASPDGTKLAQLLIGIVVGSGSLISAGSSNVLEVQGSQVIGPGAGQPGIIQSVAPGGGAVESWHAMAPAGTWTNTGGATTPSEYRLEPDNSVWLAGDISNGTPTSSGSFNIGTVPAAYRPVTNEQVIPLIVATTTGAAGGDSPLIVVTTAGAVNTANVPLGATRLIFNGKYKLDA